MGHALLHAAAAAPAVTSGAWWRQLHHWVPIGFVGAISWSVWLFRFTLSRVYRPTPPGYTATTSVVIPAYREDPDILLECLDTWLAEDPTEVIIVPDLADTEVIRRLQERAESDPRISVIPFNHSGKRSALGVGIRRASKEILLLADSDTPPFRETRNSSSGLSFSVRLQTVHRWRVSSGAALFSYFRRRISVAVRISSFE